MKACVHHKKWLYINDNYRVKMVNFGHSYAIPKFQIKCKFWIFVWWKDINGDIMGCDRKKYYNIEDIIFYYAKDPEIIIPHTKRITIN